MYTQRSVHIWSDVNIPRKPPAELFARICYKCHARNKHLLFREVQSKHLYCMRCRIIRSARIDYIVTKHIRGRVVSCKFNSMRWAWSSTALVCMACTSCLTQAGSREGLNGTSLSGRAARARNNSRTTLDLTTRRRRRRTFPATCRSLSSNDAINTFISR